MGNNLIEVICDHCGRKILRKSSRLKLTKLCFCDNSCKGQYMAGCKHGIKNDDYKQKHMIQCQTCGKKVYHKPSRVKKYGRHFCSLECYMQSNVRDNHSRWINDRSRLKSSVRATVVQFAWYYDWIRNVYARDNYICQLCGKSGVSLNAHHIISFANIIDSMNDGEIDDLLANDNIPEILTDIDNGITLCEKCHRSIRGKEMEYVDVFKNMVLAC